MFRLHWFPCDRDARFPTAATGPSQKHCREDCLEFSTPFLDCLEFATRFFKRNWKKSEKTRQSFVNYGWRTWKYFLEISRNFHLKYLEINEKMFLELYSGDAQYFHAA